MTIELTDADLEAIESELLKLHPAIRRIPPGWEMVYRAGLAAGLERAAKYHDHEARFNKMGDHQESAAAIRARLKQT